MALRLIEGFEVSSTALARRYNTFTAGFGSVGTGRYGGGSNTFANNTQASFTPGGNQATWIVGFAFKCVGASFSSGGLLVALYDVSTAQVGVYGNTDGTLSIKRGATVLATSTNTFVPDYTNLWAFVEFKATIASGTGGSATFRVNGQNWISVSGANTMSSANAYATNIRISTVTGSNNSLIDDLYICDSTGSRNNDFLGDIKVLTLVPTATGSNSDWAANTGTTFAAVSETAVNDDTTYISSSTVGHISTFNITDLTGTPTVMGVQWNAEARQDDAGTRQINRVLRTGGTNYVGSTLTMSASYQDFAECLESNPNTTAQWTATEVNALEAGVKMEA